MKYTLITLAALSGSAFAQSLEYFDFGSTTGSLGSTTATGTTASGITATFTGPVNPNYGNPVAHNLKLTDGTPDLVSTFPNAGDQDNSLSFSQTVGTLRLVVTDVDQTDFTFSSPFTLISSTDDLTQSGTQLLDADVALGDGATGFTRGNAVLEFHNIDSLTWTSDYHFITHDGLNYSFAASPVPEPSGAALLGLGGLALILRRRK